MTSLPSATMTTFAQTTPPPQSPPFVNCVDCRDTLSRLIGNVSGFVYRRREDPRWTMDFISDGCRDITGYDPHRFIDNASIAFADLVARSDWRRVNTRVRLAILQRQRATIRYLIRTASGAWAHVEDRFTPVVNAAGKLLYIEGIIDRARCSDVAPHPDEEHLATARLLWSGN